MNQREGEENSNDQRPHDQPGNNLIHDIISAIQLELSAELRNRIQNNNVQHDNQNVLADNLNDLHQEQVEEEEGEENAEQNRIGYQNNIPNLKENDDEEEECSFEESEEKSCSGENNEDGSEEYNEDENVDDDHEGQSDGNNGMNQAALDHFVDQLQAQNIDHLEQLQAEFESNGRQSLFEPQPQPAETLFEERDQLVPQEIQDRESISPINEQHSSEGGGYEIFIVDNSSNSSNFIQGYLNMFRANENPELKDTSEIYEEVDEQDDEEGEIQIEEESQLSIESISEVQCDRFKHQNIEESFWEEFDEYARPQREERKTQNVTSKKIANLKNNQAHWKPQTNQNGQVQNQFQVFSNQNQIRTTSQSQGEIPVPPSGNEQSRQQPRVTLISDRNSLRRQQQHSEIRVSGTNQQSRYQQHSEIPISSGNGNTQSRQQRSEILISGGNPQNKQQPHSEILISGGNQQDKQQRSEIHISGGNSQSRQQHSEILISGGNSQGRQQQSVPKVIIYPINQQQASIKSTSRVVITRESNLLTRSQQPEVQRMQTRSQTIKQIDEITLALRLFLTTEGKLGSYKMFRDSIMEDNCQLSRIFVIDILFDLFLSDGGKFRELAVWIAGALHCDKWKYPMSVIDQMIWNSAQRESVAGAIADRLISSCPKKRTEDDTLFRPIDAVKYFPYRLQFTYLRMARFMGEIKDPARSRKSILTKYAEIIISQLLIPDSIRVNGIEMCGDYLKLASLCTRQLASEWYPSCLSVAKLIVDTIFILKIPIKQILEIMRDKQKRQYLFERVLQLIQLKL